MSMAPLLTKCLSNSKNWAGQEALGQRCMASSSGFTMAVPHSGQWDGIWNSVVPGGRWSRTGPSTWGMTSQRISAMEKDIDRMETAIILFTKMESRIAVIETEVKHINEKLDNMKKK